MRDDHRTIWSTTLNYHITTVQMLAAGWTIEPPNDLQSLETFARSLNFEVPMPGWWYDLVHVLKEAEDKMVTSGGRIRKCHFSSHRRIWPF